MVYNVTPYMDYHPGGEEELMKAAGIDGTELFDQVGNMRDEIKHGLLYVPFKAYGKNRIGTAMCRPSTSQLCTTLWWSIA